MIQPIVVAVDVDSDDGCYVLVDGARRLAAVDYLEWSSVEVHVNDVVDDAASLISAQWAANEERVDLTDWEKAQVAMDLKLEGFDQGEVAVTMGIAKGEVSKMQKIVRELSKDEALDDVTASRFGQEALLELADSPVPEHTMDVMLRIVNGDERWVPGAIRAVENEVKLIAFYEENQEQLNEWTGDGVQLTHTNPYHHWDKQSSYGPKDDPKVASLEDIGISVADHIKLDCHMVWIKEQWGMALILHYCMNRKVHADSGKSDVKAENQEVVKAAGADPVAAAERAVVKAEKDLRRRKAGKWMASRQAAGRVNEYAVTLACATWKEEDTRAATWMLGLNSERPKGADYGWYSNRLDAWLDDKFGDHTNTASDMWKVRMLMARKYIDKFWPPDDVKDMIDSIEVTDE